MQHPFSRTERLIGADALSRLRSSRVAVFGVGGVGSHAAEALCRAGVGEITLVDFDDICLTNINRQIHALHSTVGGAKVDILAARFRDINPAAEIRGIRAFYGADTAPALLERYDVVLDCIDHFTSKIDLLVRCVESSIPVVSSMGAAARLDPTKIQVEDISRTRVDPMARTVRKLLRKQGVERGIPVVFSTEEPILPATDDSPCRSDCICPNRGDSHFSCRHRRIILGSISYIPAIFGMTMAGVAVKILLGENFTPRLRQGRTRL
ncbi:MAG: tRNA threonylcarbamoyladenosine dehydratase [Desulfuromonadia bacterium]